MKIKRICAALAAVVLLISVFSVTAAADGGVTPVTAGRLAEKMEARSFTYKATPDSEEYVINYRIYYSPSYSVTDHEKPAMLILYLHGDGGKGSDNTAQLNENGLLNYLVSDSADNLYKNYQYIVVAPQCPEGESFTAESYGAEPTDVMRAVQGLMGEIEATSKEITLGKYLVAGIGTGASAAFEYAARNSNKVSRLYTVGGTCEPARTELVYSAGIYFLSFAEQGNAGMMELANNVPQVYINGATLDECLEYAMNFSEPSVCGWLISDAYQSRTFKITASCNEDGGTISVSPASVPYGSSATVTLTVKKGYMITKVTANKIEQSVSVFKKSASNETQYTYKIDNVTASQSIVVELSRYTTQSEQSGLIDGLILALTIASAVFAAAALAVFAAVYFRSRARGAR